MECKIITGGFSGRVSVDCKHKGKEFLIIQMGELQQTTGFSARSQGYKTFFMLNSAEHALH